MSRQKNVLLISYSFPPIGGGGVPRPLKMAKYLGEFGWNVHVLTVDPAYHATLDPSLLQQVPPTVKVYRAKEPALLARLMPKPGSQTQTTSSSARSGSETSPAAAETMQPARRASLVSRVKSWLIQHLKKWKPYLFIPDDQILWYRPAVSLGRKIMKEQKIDVIFSTSGPATSHLIGYTLAKEFSCRWVVDFRDPWTQNMHRSGIAWRERLEEQMEYNVMARADAVTTVTAKFAENFRKKYGSVIKRLELIYNGFDQADFNQLQPMFTVEGKFHAAYAGIFYQKRNPRLLLQAIRQLIDEGLVDQQQIMLSFAGVFDYPGYSDNMEAVRQLGLTDVVRVMGNLPHKEALGLMKGADALLIVGDVSADAGDYIPGKLYEYMGIGKPILALNMPGEANDIVQRFQLGEVADPTDIEVIKQAYLKLYQAWQRGQAATGEADRQLDHLAALSDRIKRYERKEQARQLAQLMDELLKQTDSAAANHPAIKVEKEG